MYILAIETSCDETALALVEAHSAKSGQEGDKIFNPNFKIIKNLIASQIPIHRPFGGVVPNLAKREHLKNLPILYRKIFGQAPSAKRKYIPDSRFQIPDSIDLIAVTVGPGLEPALWTGIEFGKEVSKKYKIPIIGANHLEGHLYSFLLPNSKFKIQNSTSIFPAVALLVSGGHTILLWMDSLTKWKKLGETRDDAAGEAFDKVARILGLPYPGGPEIEKLATKGDRKAINFPRPMLNQKNYDFSFSGIKTSVLYYRRDNPGISRPDIAASFEQAAVDILVKKTTRAAKEFSAGGKPIKSIILCGGVASNKLLRKTLKKETENIGVRFLVPDFKYNTDNAVMIAVAGYINSLRHKKYPLRANGNLSI